jgi:2-polyprenyl-3-methyl-5-hydroxy-6-metoxy-1,4-benzoquinol methylase
MSETHVHEHHAHDDHAVGGEPLAVADRHAHESEIYDAMADTMLAEMSDEELAVRADRIPFHNREHVDYLSFAVDQLRPLAGTRILEVGAGSGMLAVWLALQGADVCGIDVSGGILEVAAKRASVSGVAHRTRFVHCPIEEFDDPDASFDAVIGNNVVHHFERDLAMANLARLLSPEGRAAFCEPVLFLPEIARRARYSEVVSRRFPPHTHTPDERSLDQRDLRIIERYFETVSWRPFQVLCRLQNFVELSDPTWNRLEAIDRLTLRRVRSARWLARMIVLTLENPRPVQHLPEGNTPR